MHIGKFATQESYKICKQDYEPTPGKKFSLVIKGLLFIDMPAVQISNLVVIGKKFFIQAARTGLLHVLPEHSMPIFNDLSIFI